MPPVTEPTPVRVGPVFAQIAFVVVAALLVYGFVAITKEGEIRRVCSAPCYLHPDYLGADRRAPNFAFTDGKGRKVTLQSLKGKVIVLNFWSKSCGPCLDEMPGFAELAKIVKDRSDVAVLSVSIDDGPAAVLPTFQTVLHGPPPFEVLFDPDAKTIDGQFGTHLYPETWLIDPRGVIRARFDGARQWNDPLVVNYIDELRAGGYCPVKIDAKSLSGKAGRICEEMAGS